MESHLLAMRYKSMNSLPVHRWRQWLAFIALAMTLVSLFTTTRASADTPAASASAAPPPLPGYFSGANENGKPATWPDPTGAAAGVWATPAGDGKGDTPSTLAAPDLY